LKLAVRFNREIESYHEHNWCVNIGGFVRDFSPINANFGHADRNYFASKPDNYSREFSKIRGQKKKRRNSRPGITPITPTSQSMNFKFRRSTRFRE